MKDRKLISCGLVLAMLMVIAIFDAGVAQAETEQQQKDELQIKQEVRQQVDKDFKLMDMPIFTGSIWQQGTPG